MSQPSNHTARVQSQSCLLYGGGFVLCQSTNRAVGFRPLTHHRTRLLWHTAVSRRVIGPGTNVPATTLLSLLARYPDNASAPLRGFGLAPLTLPRSRLRTFQYFLALLLYVLRFEWIPTPNSALPTGGIRFDGTMDSADSLQTDYSAALPHFSWVSHPSNVSCLTYQKKPAG